MRDLFKRPEFAELPSQIVNNFGTPSIYNEFAWAFGEKTYDEDTNIVQLGTDKHIDLHMVNSIRPAPLETVRRRRKGLIDATRTLADCRVMIMTLGLVELWWDEETQNYLNTGPLPTVLEKFPERFRLHVLSFEECYSYLRRALDIAFENSRDDLSVILTVSPVPMMATHRKTDVITANSYSKSVLRAVAEQLVAEDRRISYFPSFETVSLSHRNFAWTDDLVHVNTDMIALNVERMVNAFTGSKTQASAILREHTADNTESPEALMLAERAREARASGDFIFFDNNSDAAKTSTAFALEYVKYLYEAQRYQEALDIAINDKRPEMQILAARSLIATGNPRRARDLIRPLCEDGLKETDQWRVYTETAIAMRSAPALLQVEKEWIKSQPRQRGLAQATIGRALSGMGLYDKALDRLAAAAALPDRSIATVIDCATCLYKLEKYEEAREMINGVHGHTDWQIRRVKRLKRHVDDALS